MNTGNDKPRSAGDEHSAETDGVRQTEQSEPCECAARKLRNKLAEVWGHVDEGIFFDCPRCESRIPAGGIDVERLFRAICDDLASPCPCAGLAKALEIVRDRICGTAAIILMPDAVTLDGESVSASVVTDAQKAMAVIEKALSAYRKEQTGGER